MLFAHRPSSQEKTGPCCWTQTHIVTRARPDSGAFVTSSAQDSAFTEIQQNIQRLQLSKLASTQKKTVAFVSSAPAVQELSSRHIDNLCQALSLECHDPYVGYLTHGTQEKYFLKQWTKNAVDDRQLVALCTFFRTDHQAGCPSLSVPHRVRLAVNVASSLL